MRIVEDTPDRLRLAGTVDGTQLGVGLMFLAVPMIAVFLGAGMRDGPAVVAATALPCLPLATWLIRRGIRGRDAHVVVDRHHRTIVVMGLGGDQPDVVVPFDDVVAVAPFDPQDRENTDAFTLRLETRSHGRVRLAQLPVAGVSVMDALTQNERGDAREIARAGQAHSQAAARLRALLGL